MQNIIDKIQSLFAQQTYRRICEKIKEKSLDAFFSLGCKGYGRVDFMIDDKKELFFIEVNTIPGFTDHSLMPMSAKL